SAVRRSRGGRPRSAPPHPRCRRGSGTETSSLLPSLSLAVVCPYDERDRRRSTAILRLDGRHDPRDTIGGWSIQPSIQLSTQPSTGAISLLRRSTRSSRRPGGY